MASILVTSLSAIGIIGSCCAVTFPLTYESTQTSLGGGSKDLGLSNSGALSSTIKRSRRSAGDNLSMTFEKLGEKINTDGRNKQSPRDNLNNVFPWKENLTKILEQTSSTGNSSWEIQGSDGKDCLSGSIGTISTCGFIGINDIGNDYKLNIKYEKNTTQQEEGRIFMVRGNDQGVSYGDNKGDGTGEGKIMSGITGDSLTTSINQESSGGDKVGTTAFVFKKSIGDSKKEVA